ncbi:hypothetical protein TraAM80_02318 [Trypanosoma rangeli]|uniref:Uncharacterized protein n=1 Tax=Trypanosoma rangeli TaxID=5698 RepID=A0A3R7M535_TRYRA|nr:uncharacterized protein TraAM80_02318 [Trypanosoma rangeli]RNF09173.1 hypothetical protein TraAM80_02318 [Trypanosoma rangeli]|eukprot:RNF09173.1 hypothetical protein TraAM80_02318 [Trypanosoma rangeli]
MNTDSACSSRRLRACCAGNGANGVGPHRDRGETTRVGDDALRLFLERSRQRAAQLEFRYLHQLQGCSTLPGASTPRPQPKEEDEKGPAAARGTRGTSRGSPRVDYLSLMAADDADVIEIQLEDSDDDDNVECMNGVDTEERLMSCRFASTSSTAATTCFTSTAGKKTPPHFVPASFTPQSESNSQGLSPEVYTPFASAPEEVLDRHAVSAIKESITMKYDNVATPNVEGEAVDAFMGNSAKNICAGEVAAQPETVLPTFGECDDQQQVMRCLMHAFANHLDSEASQVVHDHSQSPTAKELLDPELEEYIAWEAAKPLKRRESLQAGLNCVSYLAKIYAAAQPELCSSALFDAPGKKLAEPLMPECPPSRYIQWIASEVDCYEDLLLHLTPASREAERRVVEGVCETVLNDYITRCVVDCILHSCNAAASFWSQDKEKQPNQAHGGNAKSGEGGGGVHERGGGSPHSKSSRVTYL